ncbi:MAG TPA: amidohydrolase family protein [Bacteroidales bacterium]|nr:amidohydrolase family protein [Bacteroidales bacterium]
MIRKLSAHYIFPVKGNPIKRGIVVVDDAGVIRDIIDNQGNLQESEGLEFYDGIITPGFVNTHTHIELSHLHHKIDQHTGLAGFLRSVGKLRNLSGQEAAIVAADKAMLENGIVAAGDISNTNASFTVKTTSKIEYYTFIEVFGIQKSIAQERFESAVHLFKTLQALGLPGAVTPHAPYSISTALWSLLLEFAVKNNLTWSVHNQESNDENLLFINKTGEIAAFLSSITDEFEEWEKKGVSSLPNCSQYYTDIPQLLLVHNTFTSLDDLLSISHLQNKTTLVLCPNANLYIENRLPDIPMLAKSGFAIALGTDGLSSNTRLSILEEMKTIADLFPHIALNDLITWATLNGAKALGFDSKLGSIEKGKTPGLNLITNINFSEMKLTSQSEVNVLV